MKVTVKEKRLAAALENDGLLDRRYGREMSKKLKLRYASLLAAESLADFWPPYSGPERCHELKANLAGHFSFDLKHPLRLLLVPAADELKQAREDERSRWAEIREVIIFSIEDTHG